jgi:ABC-type multidrug transport system fused ATPase/permease subunit
MYDRVPILQNLSFTVPAGKTYALVGASGGGKSSILRVSLSINHV